LYTKENVYCHILRSEILVESGITTELVYVLLNTPNDLRISFVNEISAGEKVLLDDIVASHPQEEIADIVIPTGTILVSDGEGGYTSVDVLNNTVSGTIASGVSHSDLSDLTVDVHTQYIPVNGSRGFTSTVSGVTPIQSYHIATKGYVDENYGGGGLTNLDGGYACTIYGGVTSIDGGNA
jgi:hypothetical protein